MDWNRLLSRARLGVDADAGDDESSSVDGSRSVNGSRSVDGSRSDFQRDFDRIVFSAAFRRLQDKTQVFPLARSDYVRTRLTHSLEVSCVGRTLGTKVGDAIIRRYGLAHMHAQDVGAIVAAACLAHDLGNPPFGHAGEDAIRLWFQTSDTAQAVLERLAPAEREDFLRFEGNAQGFRLVARLQSPDNRGGMQLTCATLGAASKYPRASRLQQAPPSSVGFRKFGFYQDDHALFAEVAARLGLRPAGGAAWQRHPLAYLVEAADDICYRIVDLEDAFRLRLLDYEEVAALLLPLLDDARGLERLNAIGHAHERVEFLRAKAVGALVEQVAACFMAHEETLLQHSPDYGLAHGLVALIPASSELRALLDYAEAKVYVAAQVVEVGAAGFEVLGGLLEAFVAAINDVAERGEFASPKSRMLLHLLPDAYVGPQRQPARDLYRRVLGITDFVSAMTDTSAVTLYKKITGISLSA